MVKERYKFFSYLRGVIDFIMFNLAFFVAYYLKFGDLPDFSKPNQYLILHIVSNLIYFSSAVVFGVYNFEIPLNQAQTNIRKVLKAYAGYILLYFLFIVATRGYHYSRIFHLYFLISTFIFLVFDELFVSLILVPYIIKYKKLKKNVLLLGAGVLGQLVYDKIKNLPGYSIVGFLDDDIEKATYLNGKYLGQINNIENLLSKQDMEIDEIIITLPLDNEDVIRKVVEIAEKNCVNVKIIPSYHKLFLSRNIILSQIDGLPVLSFGNEKLSYLHNRVIKRLFDIIFSLFVLLIIFPPLFLFSAIGIKLSSPGPVFFKQKRKGYKGKPFTCYKFRTMHEVAREIADTAQATPDDPRKFKFGHFLRKTNLDEFPQFINVLKGEMSVVGPRPHSVYHDEKYSSLIKEYNVRFFTKPGITGWAQVNGYRGETKDPELMRKRVEHDIWYIENWSFWLDIKIIFMTLWKMIKGDPNAY